MQADGPQNLKHCLVQRQTYSVVSIPIPSGRSLRPVKNGGEFWWGCRSKLPPYYLLPPIFHWAKSGKLTLTKLPSYFLLFPYFSICTFNKKNSPFPYFLLSPIFHWVNYTINKTLSLEGKEAQNRGENLSQKLKEEPQPKTGGEVPPDFDSRFGGIEATGPTVTFEAAEHHFPLLSIRLYCLLIGAYKCELDRSCYLIANWLGVGIANFQLWINPLPWPPISYQATHTDVLFGIVYVCWLCSKLSEYSVQRGADGSVSVSDSVLVTVSGADEDSDKEVLVSWSLQVRRFCRKLFLICFKWCDKCVSNWSTMSERRVRQTYHD